jgi:hypothetical protein
VTQPLSDKMHLLASHANDLSAAGKVKAMTKNEKGFAKLISVNNGCRVWLHHTLDDRLMLDLMVTRNGQLTNPDVVKSAIAKFSQFAANAGHTIASRQWRHSINIVDVREQYYFEVTNESVETVIELIAKVRLAFQNSVHGSVAK